MTGTAIPALGQRFQSGPVLASTDFASIGHMETWESAAAIVQELRGEDREPLSLAQVREILPWIPPRTVSRVVVRSRLGVEARGVYIDTFLLPDELDSRHLRSNLERVRQAAEYAIREGARVSALGGFSSIVLEGLVELLPQARGTVFTTGNTLTVAYIVKALEQAAEFSGLALGQSTLLVVGASGDVGFGCARYLLSRVKRVLLCARNAGRLQRHGELLGRLGADVRTSTNLNELLAEADLVIFAASLPAPSLSVRRAKPGAILCDAGYPRNITPTEGRDVRIFAGGMGQVLGGLQLKPDLTRTLLPHPFPHVVHGCLLEGILLALERRYESFSRGRGLITPEKVDEIWRLAQKHGFALAPFFHGSRPWEEQPAHLEELPA